MKRTILVTAVLLAAGLAKLAGQDPALDPRALGMAGATTSNAQGIHAIGFNPARLAYSEKDFSLNLGGVGFGILNNYLSVALYNEVNGADFEDPISKDFVDKQQFLAAIPNIGMQIIADMHIPVPGLQWSRGTTAFTSDIIIYSTLTLPKSLFELFFEGNIVGKEIRLPLDEEIIGIGEWAFSFAMPQKSYSLGLTLKYLQGLFYLGVDQDSSGGFFITDTTGFRGEGRYLIRQAVGGSGIGLDFGFATAEVNGLSIGFSVINAFGSIKWHGPSVTKDLFGDALQALMPWRENEYFLYTFKFDEVTAIELLGGVDADSLFVRESYTVFVHPDSGLVRSANRDLSEFAPKSFVTNYPTTLRAGVTQRVEGVGLFTLDLLTGFEDRLWSSRGWELAIGMEIFPSPSLPIRMGYRYGGANKQLLGMGIGLHKGPIQFDLGLAFHNGVWVHTMKGLSLAFSATLVR